MHDVQASQNGNMSYLGTCTVDVFCNLMLHLIYVFSAVTELNVHAILIELSRNVTSRAKPAVTVRD